MLAKLDPSWLVFAVVTVALVSYIVAIAIDALLGDATFGVLGNAAIVTAGFFAAIYGWNVHGHRFSDLSQAVFWGIAGGFGALLLLVLLKGVVKRLS